jgi:hypothetical protein
MLSIVEKDLGTPKRESAELVTLTIDGQEVTVPAGTSVMRAAALSDVKIPKLCGVRIDRVGIPAPRRSCHVAAIHKRPALSCRPSSTPSLKLQSSHLWIIRRLRRVLPQVQALDISRRCASRLSRPPRRSVSLVSTYLRYDRARSHHGQHGHQARCGTWHQCADLGQPAGTARSVGGEPEGALRFPASRVNIGGRMRARSRCS